VVVEIRQAEVRIVVVEQSAAVAAVRTHAAFGLAVDNSLVATLEVVVVVRSDAVVLQE
jgi:hypothetical protein